MLFNEINDVIFMKASTVSTLLDIVFIIYIDIILVVCMLTYFITTYFIEWQDEVGVFGEAIKTDRYPRFPGYFMLLMLPILILVCSNKHIITKIIGTWSIFSFTRWVISAGIPDSLIDMNIGPRFREQYYEIIKTLPDINLILCIILGILIILFKKKQYFDPTKSKINRIVILSIIAMIGFIIPNIIVPIIKPWEWHNII